jgi:hypothetical protein
MTRRDIRATTAGVLLIAATAASQRTSDPIRHGSPRPRSKDTLAMKEEEHYVQFTC